MCDGKSKSRPSAQPSPLRLTPEPPAPKPVTSVEVASQTTCDLLDLLLSGDRSTSLPNGAHSAHAESSVASSSKTKLDTHAPAEEVVAPKRKAPNSSTQPSGRDEKRSRKLESDSPATNNVPNGIARNHTGRSGGSEEDAIPPTGAKNCKHPPPPKASKSASAATAGSKSKNAKVNKKKKKGAAVAPAAGEEGDDEEIPDVDPGEQSPTFVAPKGSQSVGGRRGAAASQNIVIQFAGRAKAVQLGPEDITLLTGHSAEVFSSAWNPSVSGLIASAGGDATVRIWDIPLSGQAHESPAVCKHLPTTHNKDVSTLEWNSDGTLLASGSYDGILRLWTPQGDLHLVMSMHQGPIFAVRWNRKGTMLLTSSADGTAIVWDLSSGKVCQQFPIHSDSVLDVDWLASPRVKGPSPVRNDMVFATGSADNSINLCRVGESKPIRTLRGHDDEVNAIRFDASQTLLASASDDKTARIWAIDSTILGSTGNDAPSRAKRNSKGRGNSAAAVSGVSGADSSMDVDRSEDEADVDVDLLQPVAPSGNAKNGGSNTAASSKGATCKLILVGHTKELYALEWAPTGPGSANPSKPRMLATSSFDGTARIWNADDGSCLRVIDDHADAVYSLCWSPDALFLATGAIDSRVYVTRLADGAIVKSYAAGGQVFDVSWHVDPSSASSDGAVKEEESEDGEALAGAELAHIKARHQLAVAQSNRTLAILDLGKLVAQHGGSGDDLVATTTMQPSSSAKTRAEAGELAFASSSVDTAKVEK